MSGIFIKKRFLIRISVAFILACMFTHAEYSCSQSVYWAKEGGSPGYEYGNAITTDDSGNVFVAGQIEYTSYFDSIALSANGIHDIFVGKFGPDGSIQWLQSEGGIGGDVGYGIGIDASKNTYITGEIEEDAEFGSGTILQSAGDNDFFIAKYDYYGNLSWAKRYGGSESDKGYGMAVSPSGNSFVTGYFSSSSINFGGTSLNNSGQHDVFTVKFDASGNVLWAKKGGGNDDDIGYGIASDKNGNVYVAGSFTGSASFSGHSVSTSGNVGGFLIKYNSSGSYQWIEDAGACCDVTENLAVATDENGNVYVAGYFIDKTKYGSYNFTSTGGADIILAKYDPSGNLVWAKQAGGPYDDMANSITVDTVNHLIYVTGQLDDHGYFDSHYVGAAGNRDVFIAAYDMNGQNLWVKAYGGVYRDVGLGITVEPYGSIYTSGFFTENGYFGPDTLTGHPIADLMVFKVAPSLSSQPVSQVSNITATAVNCNDLRVSFTPGNGDGRIVVARAGSPVNAVPVDGNYYSANSVFGSGYDLGNGNFVVYNGAASNVTVTGLASGIVYYFAAFEYNGTGSSNNYLTGGPANCNLPSGGVSVQVSAASPSICSGSSTALTATGNATSFSWSPATGLSSTSGTNVTANPTSTITYTVTATSGLGCISSSQIVITVDQTPVINLGNDTILCAWGSLPLSAGSGFSSYSWSTGATSSGIYIDSSGTGIGTVNVSLQVTNNQGCTGSDEIQVTFDLCNGISEHPMDFHGFTFYPNPFRESLFVNSVFPVSISLYDVCGRLIEQHENFSGSLQLGMNLSEGLYYLQLKDGKALKGFSVLKLD